MSAFLGGKDSTQTRVTKIMNHIPMYNLYSMKRYMCFYVRKLLHSYYETFQT